ncbi:MAG: urease accessory protein UreF, partial [Nocardioides sp.]
VAGPAGRGAPRSVVLAAAADAAGLSPVALARLVGYDDAQTVCAAALKLLPMDPAVATGWVLDALPVIEDLSHDVAALTDPAAIPASGAPQFEAWAQAHAAASRRLFSA